MILYSQRLRYERVTESGLDDFHRLVQDDHVRRYLMDGQVLPREWSVERIRESETLFLRSGVGIWLAYARDTCELTGFCGFLELLSVHAEPQLVYALLERFTGAGYATEMARTSIAEARRHAGLDTIVARVDEATAASVRVLEKLGFRAAATQPGSFGPVLVMVLEK